MMKQMEFLNTICIEIVNRSIIYCIVPILITPLIFYEYPCLSHPQNLQTTFSYPFVMDYEMQRRIPHYL